MHCINVSNSRRVSIYLLLNVKQLYSFKIMEKNDLQLISMLSKRLC